MTQARTTRRCHPSTCKDFLQTNPPRAAVTTRSSTRSSTGCSRAPRQVDDEICCCTTQLRGDDETQDLLRSRFDLNMRPPARLFSADHWRLPRWDSSHNDASWTQIRDNTEPPHHSLSFPQNFKPYHTLNHHQFYSQWVSIRQPWRRPPAPCPSRDFDLISSHVCNKISTKIKYALDHYNFCVKEWIKHLTDN